MPYKDPAKKQLWAANNHEKTRQRQAAYKKSEKGKITTKRHNHTPIAVARRRNGYYLRNYGLNTAQAQAYKLNIGECQICTSKGPLVIDHCHITQTLRGVLCNKCNKALGLLGDTKEGVQRALAYFK